MRLNQFIARATGMSRRAADEVIQNNRVKVNHATPSVGQQVEPDDIVTLDEKPLQIAKTFVTIALHKPVGYICSRDGQGSKTVYDLLPPGYQHLKTVGRLDKDSSGLLLLTNDGTLAHELTHPSFHKEKRYEVRLHKELAETDFKQITTRGVQLDDGLSRFDLRPLNDQNFEWYVIMREGRNRQIRRTFSALGYTVRRLHRTHFGPYQLKNLEKGQWHEL